jgi:predicted ATPase
VTCGSSLLSGIIGSNVFLEIFICGSSLTSYWPQSKGLYLTGKFDFYLRDEPYSGFDAVFRELCGEILMLRNDTSTEAKYQEICDGIVSELGDEISLLTNIFPVLDEILDIDYASAPAADSSDDSYGKEGINYAFRKFLRVVSTHFKPLVIVLDDLQWADAASFELLETLITEGCKRSRCHGRTQHRPRWKECQHVKF